MYTCTETRSSYEIVKKLFEKIRELEKNKINSDEINKQTSDFFMDFRKDFKPMWKELHTSPNPDFGACENCIKNIKLKHVKKHKNFLKNSDDSMWDFVI